MKTRIKLGDILAVQCLNITTIAGKVLKWVMAYFSTIVLLATSMMFAGSGEKVEETTIAMTMLIIAVVALCTSYLIGLLLSILIKYVILAEDSESYMLRSLDRVTTVFAIIIGAVTISVPIVEHQVSNALHKLIFSVGLYLLLLVVKRIIIHFLPERIFVSEKHEYVSHHLKYSWMTFNSAIGTVTQISPNTLAKVTDKFEDMFHLSMDDSENVESDNNHAEIDDNHTEIDNNHTEIYIPALHTADSLRLPKHTEITRVIPESASITRFRDKYPFKKMGPVNNHKLPLEHPLRIIGTGHMPHVVASVSNISNASNDASDASNDASDASDESDDDDDDASEDDDDDESDDDDDGPYSPMGDIVI